MQDSRHQSKNKSKLFSKYIVGLTGGIGSGKTAASNIFARMGVEIIDADEISRSLVNSGSPCFEEVVLHFGRGIVDSTGNLDRAKLRELIFNNEQQKQWLENLLHPLVKQEIERKIEISSSKYIIVSVPLLLESGNYDFIDRILVVDVPEKTQVSRIMQRDGNSENLARQIMDTQVSRDERLKHADDILDNNNDLGSLEIQIKNLHEKYLRLASTK